VREEALSKDGMERIDSRRLFEIYERWPALAEEALKSQVDLKPRKYKRVIYLAVGGSASAGDIISDWFLSSGGVEVSVFRGYIPNVDIKNALIIACSTSGDAAETVDLARELSEKECDMVAISSGGKLKALAESRKIPHVTIRMTEAPRYSLPSSLWASIAVLKTASLLDGFEWELEEADSNFKKVGLTLGSALSRSNNQAKEIAASVANRDLSIYSASATRSVGARFKTSLNENAKMHVHDDSSPNLFHNEVEAWEDPDSRMTPIFLRRAGEPPSEAKSLDAFALMLKKKGVESLRADGTGKGNLSQLVTLCYILDFASYYAGILRNVNPLSVKAIDELKRLR
jgi:glucose/mannose-6-phosphate isomerase